MLDISYLITPFIAWLVAGTFKFVINSAWHPRKAFSLIGYGGMPSNHTAIVSSMAMLIALKHGIHEPAFGVALTLGFIVVLDATSLRRQVGQHASALNTLRKNDAHHPPLRERMGHSHIEVAGGAATGAVVACLISEYLPGIGGA